MSVTIRQAVIADIETIAALLVSDASARAAQDATLWGLDRDPHTKVAAALSAAMTAENPPFRQQWLLAEAEGMIVGMAHSILLPVPPIYAGEFGAPGLIMEDCFAAETAPEGTRAALLAAAEADLIDAGAQLLLASSIAGGAWANDQRARGYEPLTLYYAKVGLTGRAGGEGIRAATEQDVPAIVAASAENRTILFALDDFWKPHPDADARFGGWMGRSLTLKDRDMLVSENAGALAGYAIAQPATALHFPAAHDVAETGFMDDYFHSDFADADHLADDGAGATALLHAAEAALARRGNQAALIVCPAGWASKRDMLEHAGYEVAIVWSIKRAGR